MLSDTSPEAERVHVDLLRRAGAARRGALMENLTDEVRRYSIAGLVRRHVQATPAELRLAFVRVCYGAELADRVARTVSHERLESPWPT